MKNSYIISLLAIVFFSSCFKEDEAVMPFPRGDAEETQVAMGSNYEQQIYFDLQKNEIVMSINRTSWDLAFSCSEEHTIKTNTGKAMYIARTGETDLNAVTDTAGLEFKWDWSNGKSDSTALNDWWNEDEVYVVDLGYDLEINHLGFAKMKLQLEGESLKISYSSIEELSFKDISLEKDEDYNFVYFSFETEAEVVAEPKKTEYDLVFRQYLFYFEEEDISYLVNGVLINPYLTSAYREFETAFDEIEMSSIDETQFTVDADIIGYDWKYFDLALGTYTVQSNQNYILKNRDGFIYKIHFIGFYNDQGEKGHPVVAFQLL